MKTFSMDKEPSLGTRETGKALREKIEIFLQTNDKIVLDFKDVGVMSSGFADEVFGRLFVKMGFRSFTQRIVIKNADETIDGLIDRAISQRSKLVFN